MPAWLANYPGVEAQTNAVKSLVEVTYVAPAKPGEVALHYRKLFQEQNLPFAPSFDGMGTVVRGTAPECDLMISIRAQGSGTAVRVDCTARSSGGGDSWTAVGGSHGPTPGNMPPKMAANWEQMMARQEQFRQQIHKPIPPAPAPPLVWPEWLVHIDGRKLSPQAGVDQSQNQILKCRYVTSRPMTAIHTFYKDLLTANDYKVYRAKLETGQTISGVVQNADGYVEGDNYPNGSPGPWTEIHVSFSRMHLNDPITVDVKFTTYAFKGANLGQQQ